MEPSRIQYSFEKSTIVLQQYRDGYLITLIRAIPERRGNGTKMIEFVKQRYPILYAYPLPSSKEFFNEMGFDLETCCFKRAQ